ncbi:stimulator of interferon genes protein 7 [Hydra vulgaris]|uniref:Transmembrane protein 173 n=1 Tax=Hydra vulgaris TaxID=6087 RepID=T2MAF2_HYDVU|nr:stimulator of interferon genes protein [Hydra vulgaris]
MVNSDFKQNNGFGHIFNKRRGRELYIMLYLLCFLVAVYYLNMLFFPRSFKEDLILILMVVSSIIIGEFLRRICFFSEEIFHSKKRYNGSIILAFKNCITVTSYSGVIWIILAFSFSVTFYQWIWGDKKILSFTVYATYMICSSIVMHLLKLKEPSIIEYSHLNEVENKHLAAGLAWGYYFGYLKEQLPKLKILVDGAVAPHSMIEGDNACKYLKPIMYIIIPKDCNCTENLANDYDIKFHRNCLEDIRSTGGVHDRSYKNSVYSIEPREPQRPKKYVIMEYATPLNNLFKMSKHREANFSDEDLEREVILFYKKLKSILDDDPNCINHYKLILLSSASQENIADVLYREINDEENFFNNNVNV